MPKLNDFNLTIQKICLALVILLAISSQRLKANENIPDILVRLSAQKITIDNQNVLAISFKNEPHWHTYWKNPGDAGLPIKIIDQESSTPLLSYEWPTPERYIEPGNAWAYGYENDYTLFFKLPKKNRLNLQATWLVCKHICIPGKAEIFLNESNIGEITPNKLSLSKVKEKKLIDQFKNLPANDQNFLKELDIIIVKDETKEDSLILYYNLNKPTGNYLNKHQNLLFPFPNNLLDFKHEDLYIDNDGHLYAKMTIEWNGYYVEPEVNFPKDLNFESPLTIDFLYSSIDGISAKKISKTFKTLSNNSEQLRKFYSLLTPIDLNESNKENSQKTKNDNQSKSTSLFSFLFLAFLGGLILNLMPCVLPVITLKLFSLTSMSSESKKKIASHNLFYSLGVISTFWVLALVISLLKVSGNIVGWGFQLQSPIFILIMATGLFIFSLNMFGLFEFITPGGKSLGSIKTSGKAGDFLNGVLATILSTPCSAPFLGTALAFAFTQGPEIIFLIFTFVGLGLAFPFILTIFLPGVVKFFPRPGNWMNTLKAFLGLSLLCTSIWLLSILNSLISSSFIYWILISYSCLFFGIYLYQKTKFKKLSLIVFFGISIFILINKYSPKISENSSSMESTNLGLIKKAGLSWEKWSVDKLKNYQNKKVITFIDFTADWCLTCKVNEKVVISSKEFKTLVNENQVSLLLGDWTNGNEEITNWLLEHNMAGVPAYFFIDRNGKLHNLGETVTIKKVRDLLSI